MLAGAKALYSASPAAFIHDAVWIYEPRNANKGLPVKIPAVPFPRQREFIEWLHDRFRSRASGPVEKSRDSGATWIASAFAVWLWLFHPGASAGFGSRKEILVDRNGDMSSIFEKIRSIIRHLPSYLKPDGFQEKAHLNYMRILNPENAATIIGEAGDNIGRGGRTSVYFIDESAFLERPQMVDAALTAATDCRIDISTPNVGSIFDEWCAKTTAPDKFVFDVSDAPWHTEEWRNQKRAELEIKGLGHLYRREYLRDAAAGLAGQLISSEWIESAIGAAEKLGIVPTGAKVGALDVSDGGADSSVFSARHGIALQYMESRPETLADAAGLWAYREATMRGCEELRYDAIGVGAGAAASLRDKKDIKIVGWSGADAVMWAEKKYENTNRTHADMFLNRKAQAWWLLRDRFIKTHRAVTMGKMPDSLDDLISIPPDLPELRELKTELAQVTYKDTNAGKVQVNKAPDGQRSPNRADSVVICYGPAGPTFKIIGLY